MYSNWWEANVELAARWATLQAESLPEVTPQGGLVPRVQAEATAGASVRWLAQLNASRSRFDREHHADGPGARRLRFRLPETTVSGPTPRAASHAQ